MLGWALSTRLAMASKIRSRIAAHQHLAIADDCQTGAVLFGRSSVQLDDLTGDLDQIHDSERALRAWGPICAIRVQ